MSEFLDQDIKFLPGVGPKRAELLNKELNIKTFGDLFYYFPFKYIDRTKFYKISEIHSQMPYIQVKGEIRNLKTIGPGNKERLSARFFDETGSIELIWFRSVKWQKENLKLNKEYIVFGKPAEFGGNINVVHPEMETEEEKQLNPAGLFQGYYITSENMKKMFLNSKAINKLQLKLIQLAQKKINESLPAGLINRLKLTSLENALISIHKPENTINLKNARFRLKFEELFHIQLKILALKLNREKKFKGFNFEKVGFNFNTFYNDFLPFELTGAQKKVIKEIRRDVNRNIQMNRLLQGDVGSGKTLVALMTMFLAMDNGFQSALMAPTEILAQQHFQSISKFLEGMNIQVGLLTGSTKVSERKTLHEKLKSGELQILIGTHALIEDTVVFKNLGLVVIDEQHRFGVAQRAKLWQKNELVPPHILVMTATPIPRTLAMTVYGDLDVSVIDELPPGRKPIETMHFFENRRNQLNNFLRQQLEKGTQIYVVYPLISESEKIDLKNLEEGFRHISEAFPNTKIGMVHGKMKPVQKENAMRTFKKGETKIMVATTVIEVGVDVPNASVMVIESAERFGLSQLHQLRGRVGRGAAQSFCILMSSYKISTESRKRLSTMVRTNDGFEIAEVDMKLRGPGEIEGTQQSGIGFDLKIANLGKDSDILKLARNEASEIIDTDPLLQNEENKMLRQNLMSAKQKDFDWSSIS
ncbi:MAG: ATP-dependent DNA helicase RecG [Prolixibacteraceae bacterium]|jgi:ATP-dependent DNA helicase RecG|nr:ATP-dependent DNA helicase RecG [Prolixibacteraceae bacterium]MBT6998567.1 ATP-dependent DNA helicase RecG [Prolixibacteraceae bacterium]MBT7395080.1 ATP-dependent DNA helicase RecG [Prolixibacteraceae bacterium]